MTPQTPSDKSNHSESSPNSADGLAEELEDFKLNGSQEASFDWMSSESELGLSGSGRKTDGASKHGKDAGIPPAAPKTPPPGSSPTLGGTIQDFRTPAPEAGQSAVLGHSTSGQEPNAEGAPSSEPRKRRRSRKVEVPKTTIGDEEMGASKKQEGNEQKSPDLTSPDQASSSLQNNKPSQASSPLQSPDSPQENSVTAAHPTETLSSSKYASSVADERPISSEPSFGNPSFSEAKPSEPSLNGSDEEATPLKRKRKKAQDGIPQEAEEETPPGKSKMPRVWQGVLAILFPIVLLIGTMRLIATPFFTWIEYIRPGFPDDKFDFSGEDRITYGSYVVDFLNNFAGGRYLGDLKLPDGDPLFTSNEVSHMADVKGVYSGAMMVGLCALVISLLLMWYLARRSPGAIRRAFFAGSIITLVLVIGGAVLAILGWDTFFNGFHRVFFADGTWTFDETSSLIRLFPTQYWLDAAGSIAAITVLVSLVFLITTWPTKQRRENSRLRAAQLEEQKQSIADFFED